MKEIEPKALGLEQQIEKLSINLDFWFSKSVPNQKLHVVCQNAFDMQRVEGITWEDFLCKQWV